MLAYAISYQRNRPFSCQRIRRVPAPARKSFVFAFRIRLQQARLFTEAANVTGIVLTKLDGSAKGGIVVAIAHEMGLPVRYAGVGEKIDDIIPFDAEAFVDSLID